MPGGATYREAASDHGDAARQRPKLVGSLDVVELNPFLDDRGKSAVLLVDLVASLFGRHRQIIDRAGALERASSASSPAVK